MLDLADKMFAWEDGELDQDEVIELFQDLIDCGWCWTLQGCYGRQAADLIRSGLCHPAGQQPRRQEEAE